MQIPFNQSSVPLQSSDIDELDDLSSEFELLTLKRCESNIWCRSCSFANHKMRKTCMECNEPLHCLKHLAQLEVNEELSKYIQIESIEKQDTTK